MSYQDLTTYVEVDPNSHITVTAARVAVADLPHNEDAWVYKDFGAAFFGGDFYHKFDSRINSTTQASGLFTTWSLQNEIDDRYSIDLANGSNIAVSWLRSGSEYRIYLQELDSGTSYSANSTTQLSADTTYYFRVKRDEAVGTYGTIYCDVYASAANRDSGTSPLVSLSIALHTSKKDYRYLFVAVTYQDTNPVTSNGWAENYELNTALTLDGTSTVSIAPTINKVDSSTLAGTSTVAIAPTGGSIVMTVSMTASGTSAVSMAPTGRFVVACTITGTSSITMAASAVLTLHPYSVIGFPAGATVQYKILDIDKVLIQDWTNTDVEETATGLAGWSVYDVALQLTRGFQGLILWKIANTIYHAEEPIDMSEWVYPTLLEMERSEVLAKEATVNALPTLAEIEASSLLAKQAKLDFMQKWALNKLVESPSGDTVTLYDDDGVTPLKTWPWNNATKTRSAAT